MLATVRWPRWPSHGRMLLSVRPRQGFWWVLISLCSPIVYAESKVGVFFIENCQNNCWESAVCVESMGF